MTRKGLPAGRVGRSPWQTLVADEKHGPLPLMLLVLTVLTGVVDAVSILSLGRVFVANMTGNVVFSGFALAGAAGFSLSASLFALGGFLVGALAGGAMTRRLASNRAVLLRDAVAAEAVLIGAALVVAAVVGTPFPASTRDVLSALAAAAMGGQNAVVRKLAVPDLTTTVLTMTLTGIAADEGHAGRSAILRRVLGVAAMLGGAVGGAALVLNVSATAALGLAALLLAGVTGGTAAVARAPAPWQ